MKRVHLIPPVLPVPKAVGKAKKVVKTKEQTMQEKYNVTNTDSADDKHPAVQSLWKILSKMDPKEELWSSDTAILSVEGYQVEGRRLKDLGFTAEEDKLIRSVSILDCTEADNNDKSIPESAIGSITTVYQLVELAYNMGKKDEIKSVLTNESKDSEEDEDFDEELDIDEEDYDEEDEDEGE